jgi:long-chain acyl-CoA synthetase
VTPIVPSVATFPSLGALLDDALVRHRSRTLLVEVERKREASRWTGGEIDAAASRHAARLQALGIRPGDRVALFLSNSPRWLVTAIAVFRCGAVLVPLDPKLEPPEQVALLAHARPSVLVVDHAIWVRHTTVPVPHVIVSEAPEGADLRGGLRWEDVSDATPRVEARTPSDLACIVYSSGTGGRPKGCQLAHRAYLAQLEGLLALYPMAPGDVYFSVLPTHHAIDFMVGFVGPFVCGATVVHQRTLRPEMLRFAMQRYGVTHMSVVPMLLEAFDRAVREKVDAFEPWKRSAFDALVSVHARLTASRPNHALSSRMLAPIHAAFGGRLRLLVCGGAWTDRAVVERLSRLGIPVVIGYGLTEACTVVTVNRLTPARADTVGAAVDGVEVRIERPDAEGVGEVCVRGPTLMEGYLDDPELTAETLIDGWLHTGDLGYLDAGGHLHLCGRCKDVIVSPGGKNVYPEDVEHAFAALPVEEVAVFAGHTLWPVRSMTGESLVLVVRPKEDAGDLLARIAEANRRLPDFKRVAGVLTVDVAFPRTATLKVKRKELAARLAELPRERVVSL